MKFSTGLVVALAAGLIAVTPALAQSNTDNPAKPMATDSGKKQPTQGAPAGFQPQQYGASAKKQPTAGAPAGFEPQKYGSSDATKNQ
jgi:hypothetical protein